MYLHLRRDSGENQIERELVHIQPIQTKATPLMVISSMNQKTTTPSKDHKKKEIPFSDFAAKSVFTINMLPLNNNSSVKEIPWLCRVSDLRFFFVCLIYVSRVSHPHITEQLLGSLARLYCRLNKLFKRLQIV